MTLGTTDPNIDPNFNQLEAMKSAIFSETSENTPKADAPMRTQSSPEIRKMISRPTTRVKSVL